MGHWKTSICVAILIMAMGCAHEEIPAKNSHCQDCLLFEVQILNQSSILVEGTLPYETNLTFGNEYSNAQPYIELLEPQKDLFAAAAISATKFSYVVHFPIYWYKTLPYGTLLEEGPIVESIFIFPRMDSPEALSIDFPYPVFLSGYGIGKNFVIRQSQLMNSYIAPSDLIKQCSKQYGTLSVTLLSVKNFMWNASYCDQVFSVVDYYMGEFGNRLQSNYTLTFSNARSYTSLPSGFFVDTYNLNFIAHELFHAWQPQNRCMQSMFYNEGLAVYMQHKSQLKAGIITEKEFDSIMKEYKRRISSMPDIKELYFKKDLDELRRNDSMAHGILIYAKGALLWHLMQQQNVSIEQTFIYSLNESSCVATEQMLLKSEQKLFEEINGAQ